MLALIYFVIEKRWLSSICFAVFTIPCFLVVDAETNTPILHTTLQLRVKNKPTSLIRFYFTYTTKFDRFTRVAQFIHRSDCLVAPCHHKMNKKPHLCFVLRSQI